MKPVDSTLPPEDDLDAQLGAFFRSEMPDPWPTFQPPLSREEVLALPARPKTRNWPLLRSRLALAASIALLIGAALWLPTSLTSPPDDPRLDVRGSEAKRGGLSPFVPVPAEKDKAADPAKYKSSMFLRQDSDGRTGIGVLLTPDEAPPDK